MEQSSERAAAALDVVRVAVAGLIFIHGATRFYFGGVEPFGGWLDSQGFPFGCSKRGR